jgi:alkylphosphonate utilization operon protein PhnA
VLAKSAKWPIYSIVLISKNGRKIARVGWVKGFSKSIKVGTKVTNIRLVEGDHNIDCKVPGFGGMALKSEFVKKA